MFLTVLSILACLPTNSLQSYTVGEPNRGKSKLSFSSGTQVSIYIVTSLELQWWKWKTIQSKNQKLFSNLLYIIIECEEANDPITIASDFIHTLIHTMYTHTGNNRAVSHITKSNQYFNEVRTLVSHFNSETFLFCVLFEQKLLKSFNVITTIKFCWFFSPEF